MQFKIKLYCHIYVALSLNTKVISYIFLTVNDYPKTSRFKQLGWNVKTCNCWFIISKLKNTWQPLKPWTQHFWRKHLNLYNTCNGKNMYSLSELKWRHLFCQNYKKANLFIYNKGLSLFAFLHYIYLFICQHLLHNSKYSRSKLMYKVLLYSTGKCAYLTFHGQFQDQSFKTAKIVQWF